MSVTAPTGDDRILRGGNATSEGTHLLAGALERYVGKVTEALGVPRDGISFEVTDTATAYIALGCRAVAHPDRDVMRVWSATQGWAVSIETDPAEPRIVLARSAGTSCRRRRPWQLWWPSPWDASVPRRPRWQARS